jgi:hypothetical protein
MVDEGRVARLLRGVTDPRLASFFEFDAFVAQVSSFVLGR